MTRYSADPDVRERAIGALAGLALGDALGMPTQSMSPDQIRQAYGEITGLVDAVADQPIAPSMAAGSVTDDTEQAILLGTLLAEGHGTIDPLAFARALLAWEDTMRDRGSLDLLGPSTKHALEQVRAGADPRTTGSTGTTNGASMRVTPVGIAFPVDPRDRFLDAVHASCMVTHDTRPGLEAATLIAAAVSAGLDGADTLTAIESAMAVATEIHLPTHWTPTASVTARAALALDLTRGQRGEELATTLRESVGTSVESSESVACSLVIARQYADRPFEGLCFAASLGGDTDTIAAMAGAILGATSPRELPADAVAAVSSQSHLDLPALADRLLALRGAATQTHAPRAGARVEGEAR